MSATQDSVNNEPVASGVQALIERLRQEGVDAGRGEAEKLVEEAESRAKWIVSQAQEEADRLLAKARETAAREKTAADEALQVAARDALLGIKTQLTQRFTGEVRRLVSDKMKNEALLQQMILEVVGRGREAIDETAPAQVLLPRDVVGLEDLRRNMDELQEGPLTQFVAALATEQVREGVSFGAAEDKEGGIRIHLKDSELTLDMTDTAVANLLLQHLTPRFRALLEGIVK